MEQQGDPRYSYNPQTQNTPYGRNRELDTTGSNQSNQQSQTISQDHLQSNKKENILASDNVDPYGFEKLMPNIFDAEGGFSNWKKNYRKYK